MIHTRDIREIYRTFFFSFCRITSRRRWNCLPSRFGLIWIFISSVSSQSRKKSTDCTSVLRAIKWFYCGNKLAGPLSSTVPMDLSHILSRVVKRWRKYQIYWWCIPIKKFNKKKRKRAREMYCSMAKLMVNFLADFSGNERHISLVKSRWNKYSIAVREVSLSVICNISQLTLKFIIPEHESRRSFLSTVNSQMTWDDYVKSSTERKKVQ